MNTLGIPEAKYRLGKALLAGGILTREYLEQELDRTNKRDAKIAKALLGSRYPSENDVLRILAKSIRVPNVRMKNIRDNATVLNLVPEELALKHKMMALEKIGNILVVVTPDIGNAVGFAEVRQETGCFLAPIQCPEDGFLEQLKGFYSKASAGGGRAEPKKKPASERLSSTVSSAAPASQARDSGAVEAAPLEDGVFEAIPIDASELSGTKVFNGLFIDVISVFEQQYTQAGPIIVDSEEF